jgi:hypothetical protein
MPAIVQSVLPPNTIPTNWSHPLAHPPTQAAASQILKLQANQDRLQRKVAEFTRLEDYAKVDKEEGEEEEKKRQETERRTTGRRKRRKKRKSSDKQMCQITSVTQSLRALSAPAPPR